MIYSEIREFVISHIENCLNFKEIEPVFLTREEMQIMALKYNQDENAILTYYLGVPIKLIGLE